MLATTKEFIKDNTGRIISNYAIANGAIVYTESIQTRDSVGYQSILVLVSGDVTISMEVSSDGTNWYSPQTTDGANISDVSQIVASLTANAWIQHTARLAYYTRYKILANLASTISFTYLYSNNANA